MREMNTPFLSIVAREEEVLDIFVAVMNHVRDFLPLEELRMLTSNNTQTSLTTPVFPTDGEADEKIKVTLGREAVQAGALVASVPNYLENLPSLDHWYKIPGRDR